MKKIKFSIFLIVFLFIIFYLYYKQGVLPYNKNDKSTKIFVIRPGESLINIIDNLAKEDLIRSKIVFRLVVEQLGIGRKIQAGDFRLSPSMNAYEIAKTLTHGTLDLWLTIVEGLRKEEIAEIVSKKFNIREIEFISLTQEGYLFPDTYLIPKNANSEIVISILKRNYKNKVNENIINQAKTKGLTENELIILASIVEKEAKYKDDKVKVGSILLKRLKNNWPLQADATIQYALGYQPKEKTWWKKYLTINDLKIDSPYNTYKYTGLPPLPICNPGLDSINAIINADEKIIYWFYLSDKTGKMHYSVTLDEHERNIKKYLN